MACEQVGWNVRREVGEGFAEGAYRGRFCRLRKRDVAAGKRVGRGCQCKRRRWVSRARRAGYWGEKATSNKFLKLVPALEFAIIIGVS